MEIGSSHTEGRVPTDSLLILAPKKHFAELNKNEHFLSDGFKPFILPSFTKNISCLGFALCKESCL